jgi:8-oxo-dGTP pyrophosphatase MutT (NUDIX family)
MMDSVLHQAGVIAYRIVDKKIQVLLMTSRETGRWIIPKGYVSASLTPAKAAEREAFEEAGVKGVIESPLPLGIYTYLKRLDTGESREARVEVYLLRVHETLKKFPERGERLFAWMPLAEAPGMIQEPGVVPLLQRLGELEPSLVRADKKR